MGAAIEKIFFDFNFLIFARIYRMFGLRKFFFIFQNIVSTRQVFTRYSLSAFIFSRFILV